MAKGRGVVNGDSEQIDQNRCRKINLYDWGGPVWLVKDVPKYKQYSSIYVDIRVHTVYVLCCIHYLLYI